MFTFLGASGFQSAPKLNGDIVLHDELLTIIPKEFYVADVLDGRDNRTAVAWLLPAGGVDGNSPKVYPVDLQGGGLAAIKHFIDHNLPRNATLRPVVITLKKFMTTESALEGGRVEGHISEIMSFDLQRGDDEIVHLADYDGSAIYNRKAGQAQEIEPTIRHLLENGLVYLNTWMNQQADTNIKLAKAVKVTFTDYEEKTEGDSVYYSAKRPLEWDDFKSNIPNNRYDAEVFPGFGYDEHNEIIKGVIRITLAMKVYLAKSACWVRGGSKNDYTLNHEQRHFDIVKLVAEHFKQKIRTKNLPVGNFDGPINVEYLESYREMDALQKQYDDETRHGSDQSAQQRWNEKIDKELKKYGIVH